MATIVNAIGLFRYLVVMFALVGILFVSLGRHSVEATIPVPNQGIELDANHNTVEGVWSDGTTMWVLADSEDKLVAYDLVSHAYQSGKDIELHSWNGSPQGIWSDGSIMWVADWDDTKLYAYSLDQGTRQDDRDIDLTGRNDGPRGVAGAGDIILVVDKDDTWVYAYDKADGTRLEDAEFDLHGDNRNPWGIWVTDSAVWVSDIDDDMLYAYTTLTASLSNVVRHETREIRLPLDSGDPRGIWSDGETMWVVDDGDDYVYAMYYRDFRHLEDEFDIDDVNEPTGVWTDGETLWVADAGQSGAGKLFAYDVSSGLRLSSKDVRLAISNENPVAAWSDGTTVWVVEDESSAIIEFLYAYALDQDPNEQELLQTGLAILLDSNNSSPVGVWSDGDTIWVSDSEDDKLYAYDLAGNQRQSARDITLVNGNADPGGIWGDGNTIWVLDTVDKHVYAYSRGQGTRKPAKEFRPAPANDNLSGGLTGHGLRFWVVDTNDEKVYAYGNVNTPPTFDTPSAAFNIHYSLEGGEYVGEVPATDPDGDSLTFDLSGADAGLFTVGPNDGEIRTKAGATNFTGGDEFSLTVSVSDGKSGLDGVDNSQDDAINVTVHVDHNADPAFSPPSSTTFTVAENITSDFVIAELDIIDLDVDDDLFVELSESGFGTTPPFTLELTGNGSRRDGEIKLQQSASLDFEGKASYVITLSVSDRKDDDGESDLSVDDAIQLTINVNNVDETGSLILSHSEPQVGTALSATLSDPDGVNLKSGQQITWEAQRSPDKSRWIDISSTGSTDLVFSYTPVRADTGYYLRFTAVYKDKSGTADKTLTAVTENTVLAEPPTNQSPWFTEATPLNRSVPEDAVAGSNVGAPIAASDPESDTLTFIATHVYIDKFEVDSGTGQIALKENATVDYETNSVYYLRVRVRDSKDAYGNADTGWDVGSLLTITVTNVDEPGVVTISPPEAEVDTSLTASLTDPDGGITATTWGWDRSQDAANWTPISGAASATYTPAAGDVGMYLRAVATYTDGEDTGKTASAATAGAVQANPGVDTSLDSLTLDGISFTFSSAILEYALEVPNTKELTTVTATPTVTSGVSVEITPGDSQTNRNGHQVDLDQGENVITITVSEDQGSASTTYTARVTRASSQRADPPPTDPQRDDGSETDPKPSLAEQCRNDWAAGLLAECSVTRFAVVRVGHDGSYNINWSEWDSDNPHVTGYTIAKNKFIYKLYKDDNGTVSDAILANVYDNCQFVDNRWACEGPARTNLFEDWGGNPTQPVELAANADITEWSSSLDAAGRHAADETFHLWSGDAADPNNTPTSVTYRTTSFDMHLYYFSMHKGSQAAGRETLLVNGADGFDEV